MLESSLAAADDDKEASLEQGEEAAALFPLPPAPATTKNIEVWCAEAGREDLLGDYLLGDWAPDGRPLHSRLKGFTPVAHEKVPWTHGECAPGCPVCAETLIAAALAPPALDEMEQEEEEQEEDEEEAAPPPLTSGAPTALAANAVLFAPTLFGSTLDDDEDEPAQPVIAVPAVDVKSLRHETAGASTRPLLSST